MTPADYNVDAENLKLVKTVKYVKNTTQIPTLQGIADIQEVV